MAQIRALNLALQFAMTPIVAFVTFATYRAMSGELNVPSVFYALRCGAWAGAGAGLKVL
jgi:hypothetical protein